MEKDRRNRARKTNIKQATTGNEPMRNLIPNVPPGCQVIGHIYWDSDHRVLGEDMLDLQLANGILISCGWYPEGSPNGSYRITVGEGFHEIRRTSRKNDFEACAVVERFALDFSGPVSFTSESASLEHDIIGDRFVCV